MLNFFKNIFGSKQKQTKEELELDRKRYGVAESINYWFANSFHSFIFNNSEPGSKPMHYYRVSLITTKYVFKNAQNHDVYRIEITCHSPGVIIGKSGRNIRLIEHEVLKPIIEQAREYFGYLEIEISLKMFDPFKINKPIFLTNFEKSL